MSYLDRSKDVIEWSSEETIIPYYDPVKKKTRRYFMDFYVKQRNLSGEVEELLVEVKPHKSTMPPKAVYGKRGRPLKEAMTFVNNQAKWEAANKYCEKKGYKFFIATEKSVSRLWKDIRF